ncbi:EAL domain-containing protein [Uliginosibacterium sp. H3]|uniref:EAL domain-containing protein n=1 Tax=Uliginosibacterium silvisoli TaxID=3114758 RepID=A0ABU6K9R3_9RHOO|nr:EAL domain-containing protein [Uliginosibacterium sp. H3]
MSLLTRLWLSVLSAMLLALAGCLVVSVWTARDYLAQQLYAQGNDNAASLALSMSQQSKDPAMAELLVVALFDSGHFESIVFSDVNGRAVAERRTRGDVADAPAWFVRLVPLQAQPGAALVSDGWKQAGRVEVKASTRYAYGALWRGSVKMAMTLLLVGLLLGAAVSLLMRWLKSPLQVIVNQAEAIGRREFIAAPEPPVKELRIVTRAMNAMVKRVQAMFAEQAERIDQLRSDANRDVPTGLSNRAFFMGCLRDALADEEAASGGILFVMRILDLAGVNGRLGRERGDALVQACARELSETRFEGLEPQFGRLGGAEFAVMLADASAAQATSICGEVLASIEKLCQQRELTDRLPVVAIGWTPYVRGESIADVMTRIDTALMQAESATPSVAGIDVSASAGVLSGEAWRHTVEHALTERAFEFAMYPVVRTDGALLHQEVMLRLVTADGTRFSAGQFMPAVLRQGHQAALDLLALELALERLARVQENIGLNLSAASLLDPQFISGCASRLALAGSKASRLWLEVSERTLMDEAGINALSALSRAVRQYGCKLGVEHFGRYFAAMPRLHEVQVDYVKLDGAFVAGIDTHEGNQRFVQAVVNVARSLEMLVIAERVTSEAEWAALQKLQLDGVTGPAVTARNKG